MAYFRQLNVEDVTITTLYVKSLSDQDQAQELRHDDILNHFSAFGDVTSVRLHNKPNQSYAFVKFTQPESAAEALQTKIHTISGRKVEIDVAHAQDQDCVSFLDLNDDCLLGIFSEKCLSVNDLCSVAETSRRLKEIAVDVFRRQYKKCRIPETIECSKRFALAAVRGDGVVAKRILVNFGSVMSDLDIYAYEFEYNKRTDILDSVAKYCSDSLYSLTLEGFDIIESFADKLQPIFKNLRKCKMTNCTFEGASKVLFADCHELVELVIYNEKDITFITDKTFQKLKHFEYETSHWYDKIEINLELESLPEVNFESFLSRHQNLQILNIRQLEQLQFNMLDYSTFDLSNFVHLRKLKIHYAGQLVRRPPTGWNNLHFLVEIKLRGVDIDSEYVRSLSQLEGLQVLELEYCRGIQNLHQIDDMNQLTKLKISECNINFDWARLIQRLGNLKYLHLDIWKFDRLDRETSLQIVDIVERRSQKFKIHFRIGYDCEDGPVKRTDVFDQHRHLVEMLIVCDNCGLELN